VIPSKKQKESLLLINQCKLRDVSRSLKYPTMKQFYSIEIADLTKKNLTEKHNKTPFTDVL